MKKLLAILLVLCMVLSLAACGGGSGSDATNPGGSNTPTQGNQGGESKDPSTQPTTQNDPDDPDYSDDEDETTEPTQTVTDLSDVPNPLGLNSLILAAYLNNAGTWNYEANDYTPIEFTQEMLDGTNSLSIYSNLFDEGSTLVIGTYYVTNKAEAANEDEYEYDYEEISCPLDFVPDFSGDALDLFLSDFAHVDLTRFKIEYLPIASISGLSAFPNLDWVYINGCENLTSLAGLENAVNLRILNCSDTNISDISALTNLTNLESVELTDGNISDLTPLAGLTNLELLRLWNNPFSDISPLADLPNLEQLNFRGTQVTELPAGGTTRVQSISYPDGMTGLGNLSQWVGDGADLNLASLDDISLEGFENFTHIHYLNLSSSNITNEDLAYLSNVAIDQLWLDSTPITDLSALAGNTGLKEISISGTSISDLSPLASCTGLEAIYAEGTQVTDVTCLAGMESLTLLVLNRTPITDLSSIAGIPNLQSLYLNYNETLTDVSPLANCPSLKYLYLHMCTGITDISALASSTTLKMVNIAGIEGLDTSAFDGTEIEIRDYY